MLLRTLLLVAYWQHPANGQTEEAAFEDPSPGVATSGAVTQVNSTESTISDGSCPPTPLMPQRFFLRRNFWGMRNTITVKDRKGVEIFTIRTKWFEWAHLSRAWRFSGAKLYIRKAGATTRGWKFNTFLSSDHEYMGTSSGTPYDLKVLDCQNNIVSMVANSNEIYRSENMIETNKAGFFTIQSGVPKANDAFIFDLGSPPKTLVKFEQREPCWLWPMCTYLTDRGWMSLLPWVAREWSGEVIQEGYGQTIGTLPGKHGGGFEQSNGANAAIDVRFLALWSTHVFGATKFSPAQQWAMGLTLIFSITWCCAHCFFHKTEKAREPVMEEEPIFASSFKDGSSKYTSPWNCCSRRAQQKSYNATIQNYSLSALASEMKKSGSDQREIDQCMDAANPREEFLSTLKAKHSTTLMSSRTALE
jgi:hypothetical protein